MHMKKSFLKYKYNVNTPSSSSFTLLCHCHCYRYCSSSSNHHHQQQPQHVSVLLSSLRERVSNGVAGSRRSSSSLPFLIVSSLKEASASASASIAIFLRSYGHQLHSLSLKLGLDTSNVFVRNALINLYAKHSLLLHAKLLFHSTPPSLLLDTASWNIMLCACVKSNKLDDAQHLFVQMPARDCVSFTTMIMGLSQADFSLESLHVFRDMLASGVSPNEVTMASVISACAHICRSSSNSSSRKGTVLLGRMTHAVTVRDGLDGFLLVSTNLVHMYAAAAVCSSSRCLADSEAIFKKMTERNVVTWNAMLNGYCKCGLMDLARDIFERIPEKDLVSWSTMVDGYLRVEGDDGLDEALSWYREMLRKSDVRPNEVMVVDLISGCGQVHALNEGKQIHSWIMKAGFDSYRFVQATVIHFYSLCRQMEDARMQFRNKEYNNNNDDDISSWNALLVGYIRNDMLDSARWLFNEMTDIKDVVSWSTMIAGYARKDHEYPGEALRLFREMEIQGVRPNEITMVSVLSAVAKSGNIQQARWMDDYLKRRRHYKDSIPLDNDNLSAALVDMYSKCGSIGRALEVFEQIAPVVSSVSPWNAMICGLAMHGDAGKALEMFREMVEQTSIRPNSITFIGVMMACCHAGLLTEGKRHLESMKSVYGIEPNIKHYGCMIDLLGRAGNLEEARRLIEESMPMEADVVIWGTMLAASRTHGNLEIGELAAERLARLEPDHGAGRVLLSNIYAGAGRWEDVFTVRKKSTRGSSLLKLPGRSGVLL